MSRKKRTGVAICTVWALTDHEGHARVLLEEAANERKLHVKRAIDMKKDKTATEGKQNR